ncbi:hypothetical protein [Intestinimonas sp. UBA1698]|uniref:hypothetical protein n=1 Tax=Intestinimonas sp. UBA1698 TaxID=1946651 RepID=UPI00257AFE13|nr:hypothetical protein [Intestinimonas sp. UBA1698]
MKKSLVFLIVLAFILCLSSCGSSSDTSAESEPGSVETSENDGGLKYGELLELSDNRETNGVVVVKAKIKPSSTNDLTVAQNYHNVVGLIANQGFTGCELQYWAVADMSDGSEGKVISFTVPADIVEKVSSGDVVATQLPDMVVDLWILPSLAN